MNCTVGEMSCSFFLIASASFRDVLCGFLFCANVTMKPKFGDLQGEVTSFTLYHQNKYLDCR